MQHLSAAILAFAALILSAPAETKLSAPAGLERVQTLLRDSVARGEHAGFLAVLAKDGQVVDFSAHGVRDVASGQPMTRDTILRIYSMTKIVTSVAVLMLHEEGRLGLDDPLAKYLPEFGAPQVLTGGTADAPVLVPAERPITLRHLLTHTSGFGDDGFGEDAVVELYKRADLWSSQTRKDFLTRAAQLPLRAQPGTAFNYSVGVDLLGAVVEQVSGQTLEDFFQHRVFEPLKMTETGFDVPEVKRPRLAVLSKHGADGKLTATDPIRGVYAESGRSFGSAGMGLFSTVDDYLRFAQMLANGGELDGARLLKEETVTLMTTVNQLEGLAKPTHQFSESHGWGLGVEIEQDPATAGFGWCGAATSYVRICPRERSVMLLFAQHVPFNEHKIFQPFVEAARAALLPERAAISITEADYEGRAHFKIATPRAEWWFDRAGGGFSRLLDGGGHDWIAFRAKPLSEFPASAAAGFRGVPNLVFKSADGGAGHAGFDHCTTERVSTDTLRTTSKNGRWQWSWHFSATHARLTMERVDPQQPYWFLYEGPVGGRWSPRTHYWGTDLGGPRRETPAIKNQHFEQWRWAYFGDDASPRVLWAAQVEPDTLPDTLWYLGNTERGALTSPDGMIVFGFGRGKDGAQFREPRQFLIGLHEAPVRDAAGHGRAARAVSALLAEVKAAPLPQAAAQHPDEGTAANPFFAMDTIARGGPEVVPELLQELGYDGFGGTVPDEAMLPALQARKLKFFNAYHVLEINAAASSPSPGLHRWLEAMRGQGVVLWLAINKVTRADATLHAISDPAADDSVLAQLRVIADVARANGVQVALYPHYNYWLSHVDDAVRIADKINRPDVGVTFNLCHWLKVEGAERDPLPVLRAALPRLMFVTISGADTGDTRTMGWDRLIQPLDAGSYDLAAFVRTLHAVGYKGPVGFQGFNIKLQPREALSRSITAWRKFAAPTR
jgi:CubicO group peptidase (beta-lactamase class C family)/sugar phosphate isomerase/epimerase